MRDRYPEYRILMKKMCPIKPLKQPEAMDLPDCSYYLHGVCISYLFNRFIADNSQCLPACNSFNFHVESPQVIKLLYLYAVFPRNVTQTIERYKYNPSRREKTSELRCETLRSER